MANQKKDEITIHSSAAEYLTYVAAVGDNADSMEMRYEDENIWLTQKMMAQLYDVDVRTINYHLKKIFEDGELQEDSVIQNFRITAADGKNYNTKHYNLQAIITVKFVCRDDGSGLIPCRGFQECKKAVLDKFPQTKKCLDKFPRTGSDYADTLTS